MSLRFAFRLFLILVAVLAAAAAIAQDADFTPQSARVVVVLKNGTTGEPGRAETVEVRSYGVSGEQIGLAHDVDGQVVFDAVEVVNFKPYLVEATSGGVVYRAQARGQDFLDGKDVTVYVFDQTDDLSGLRSPGMNVVLRRQESGLQVEYILQVVNDSRPQRTMAAGALPARAKLPAGIENLTARLHDGPQPVDVPARVADGGMVGAEAALPPGAASVVLRGLLPRTDRIQLEIAASMPVEAWSLLVFPAEVGVHAPDLDIVASDQPQYARFRGEPLAAGETVTVTLEPVPGVQAAADDIIEDDETTAADPGAATAPTESDGGFPWLPVILVVVAIAAFLAWRRR